MKAALTAIQYFAPDRAILSSFYNHPQPLWVWVDGTSISLGMSILHVDEGQRTQASIKGKISDLGKGLGKMAKNQSLPAHLQEKNSRGEDNLTTYEHHEKPTIW